MAKRPAQDLEVQNAGLREDLREAARELLSLKLIVAALLKRQKGAPEVTIARTEMAAVIGIRGMTLERVSDGPTGELLVRLGSEAEDGPIVKEAGRG